MKRGTHINYIYRLLYSKYYLKFYHTHGAKRHTSNTIYLSRTYIVQCPLWGFEI